MKKRKYMSRIVSIALALATTVSLIGCATQSADEVVTIEPMEIEQPAVYSFDAIGGNDVMPIVAYYAAKPIDYSWNGNNLIDAYTDEYFQLLYKDLGMNVVGQNYTYYDQYPHLVEKLMELAEKYEVGVLVNDRRIIGVSEEVPLETIDQYISEYSHYPAYVGNYVVDEPGYTPMTAADGHINPLDSFYTTMQNLEKLDIFGYMNMKSIRNRNHDMYEEYVNLYVENCRPKMVGFDQYPFAYTDGLDEAYLFIDNISTIRKSAEKANLPFWTFLQAGSNFSDLVGSGDTQKYYPSRAELTWSAGVALAFGTKGIQWFPVVQPNSFSYALSQPFDTQRNGCISIFGNKTRWYYYAADINKQIAAVDEVLMNSVNKGVLASGDFAKGILEESNTPYVLEGDSWREVAGITGDAIVGCFNYQGKTALYVVNFDVEYAQKVTLDLVKTCNVTVTQNAENQYISTNSLELVLEAGNGALVVFE